MKSYSKRPIVEIKWNAKIYSTNQKKAGKKEEKLNGTNSKQTKNQT